VPEWVKGLSKLDGLWKGDKASKVVSGEVGSSVLDDAMIDGAVSSAPADQASGMCLGTAGGQGVTRNVAAAGDTEVLEAKMKTSSGLGLRARIKHLMQMQNGGHHRCMANGDSALFNHLTLNRANSNLAMPRRLRNVDDAKLN
jgi:hypothetical protein